MDIQKQGAGEVIWLLHTLAMYVFQGACCDSKLAKNCGEANKFDRFLINY